MRDSGRPTPHITTAVFLVAGRGVRMHPLTLTTPKPLLMVHGRTLIEHNLFALTHTVTDIIFVVGYMGEKIRAHFGTSVRIAGIERRVHYVEQGEPRGTAHALYVCAPLLAQIRAERFFVLMGDDIYAREDLLALEVTGGNALLAEEAVGTADAPVPGGALVVTQRDAHTAPHLVRIDEGRHTGHILLNAAAYTLTRDLFTYTPVHIRPNDPTSELGLPQTLVSLAHEKPVAIVHATRWIHITDTADLARAEVTLAQ